MKKITSIILALVASMCSLTAWATEREAPTMPASVSPESGQTYYVFNTDAELFLSDYNAINVAGTNVQITITEGRGTQFKIGSYNMYTASTSGSLSRIVSDDFGTFFTITEVEDGTSLIQCSTYNSAYYNETEYLGVSNGTTTLKFKCSLEDNVHWKFFTTEDALRYRAELRLYKALNAIESYGTDWYIENYKTLYTDRANQAPDDLWTAAIALERYTSMSAGYQAPWWNERPILFYTEDGSFGQDYNTTWALPNNNHTIGSYFSRSLSRVDVSTSVSATVLIEEPSTLVYSLSGNPTSLDVYVDGNLVRHLGDQQCLQHFSGIGNVYTRFFEELSPGLHKITWTAGRASANVELRNVGVMSCPLISVNLLEPGSLGTEVLYNTDHIKNVRRLKVKGAMNSDDWGRIKMMSTLLELDLSEAQFTEIPARQFMVYSNDTTMNFLHKVKLPEGLTTIGDHAFENSFVEDINLPSTMKRVGTKAFYYSHVKELIMPDDMTDFYGGSIYGECFSYMYWLKKLVLPKNLTKIPKQTFYNCQYITEAVMPEELQIVGESAFYNCYHLQTMLPEGLKTIEGWGFWGCHEFNSPLPSTLTTIGSYAFNNCSKLETVELSVYQFSLANGVFQNCGKLKTVKLNSPIVTTVSSTSPLSDISEVTIQVPHYLVNEYKLHSYWYNAKAIEPFDYSTIGDIHLYGSLTLNHERFGGQPNIEIHSGNNYLKINGDGEQIFNNIKVNQSGSSSSKTQLLNNCDNITATGDNILSFGTEAKKWYFVSLPFDLDVSRIEPGDGAQYAIRYYDGAGRAANGKSGNWKNVDRTSIIPAGTGFIFQTDITTNNIWTKFYAADTENKYGTLRTTEFNKTLDVNASETASNRGWNLVGNPYQCYYNNHCLNFTAPITVWNPDRSTYTAYSLTDDDYAISPNEAFFVQCPNEEYNTIGFPLQGRQLTSVIESQNAVKAEFPEVRTRQLVNLTVSDGEWEDQTRVVLNEKASMAYETSCDATKFMSMETSVPQLYTLDNDGTQYAINERPMGDGTVTLGFYAGHTGNFSISVTRCDATQVFITDNQTGETTEITSSAYSFAAESGTYNTRFTLSFVAGNATGIAETEGAGDGAQTDVFSVDGKYLGKNAKSLGAGVYVLRQGKKVSKVVVR